VGKEYKRCPKGWGEYAATEGWAAYAATEKERDKYHARQEIAHFVDHALFPRETLIYVGEIPGHKKEDPRRYYFDSTSRRYFVTLLDVKGRTLFDAKGQEMLQLTAIVLPYRWGLQSKYGISLSAVTEEEVRKVMHEPHNKLRLLDWVSNRMRPCAEDNEDFQKMFEWLGWDWNAPQ